jgi:hypothetical protein
VLDYAVRPTIDSGNGCELFEFPVASEDLICMRWGEA